MSSQDKAISPIDDILSTPSHIQGEQVEETLFTPKINATEQREISRDPADVDSHPPCTNLQTSTDNERPLHEYHERVGTEDTVGIAEPGEMHAFLPENNLHVTSIQQATTKVKENPVKLLKTWWIEVTSLIIAISALIAIVVTVAGYNNKQQPAWKYALNLNTLVAILSTLMRACIVAVAEESEVNRVVSHCWLTRSSHQPAEMDVVSPTKTSSTPCSLRCSFSWSMGFTTTPFSDKNIV
jgi:hypothetical protein